MPTPPQYPAGPPPTEPARGGSRRGECIGTLEGAPEAYHAALAQLGGPRLDAAYKNWTARQIVHHVADSHANAYIRFKLALAEDVPTFRPYAEGDWANLPDARTASVAAPLALLDGVHAAWVSVLALMTPADFDRAFFHPEAGARTTLGEALAYYAWHTRHHAAQLAWLAANR